MNVDQKIVGRMTELIKAGEGVLLTRESRSSPGFVYFGDDAVDSQLSHKWGISSLSLLSRVFGNQSDYYKRFEAFSSQFDDYTPVKNALGILKGAKEDYEGGYLFETRILIEAEVFDEFLEQAEYLLSQGYFAPAAVIAGSVLEDALRKLCVRRSITLPDKPKLESMNAELARDGAYNSLVQKNVTSMAAIRNSAAHGKWTEFTRDDVMNLVSQVRAFMLAHF